MDKDYTIEELRAMLNKKEKEEAARKAEEARKKQEKLEKEKQSRKEEIQSAYVKLCQLVNSYCSDYNTVEITTKYNKNYPLNLLERIFENYVLL